MQKVRYFLTLCLSFILVNLGLSMQLSTQGMETQDTQHLATVKQLNQMVSNHNQFVQDQTNTFQPQKSTFFNHRIYPDYLMDVSLTLCGVGLCHGSDPISAVIRYEESDLAWFKETDSPWSHIGAILVDSRANDLSNEDNWYFFESTGVASQILLDHQWPGVQISRWKDAVKNYSGNIARRTLKTDNPIDPDIVTKFVHDYFGRLYETHVTQLLDSLTRSNKKNDLTSVFCSELVAELFITLKLVDPRDPNDNLADNYLPKDWGQNTKNSYLKLINAQMGDEIMVKGPGATGNTITVNTPLLLPPHIGKIQAASDDYCGCCNLL